MSSVLGQASVSLTETPGMGPEQLLPGPLVPLSSLLQPFAP